MNDSKAPPPLSGPSTGDRLDSWKEIASFLGRGVRTVQRWEREEGLPIHRLVHEKRGSIYARREELTTWWESRRLTLAAPMTAVVETPAVRRLERVTRTSAMTNWPALSWDARLIAYVSDGGQDGTTPQIWIQQIGGAALRLTNGEHTYSHLSFSPDNTRIIFTTADDFGCDVCEVPALGGQTRILQRGAKCGQISPDGRWRACVPRDGAGIWLAARDSVGVRTVAPELVDIECMTWLPDSRSVIVHARPAPTLEPDWWIVPIDAGVPTNTGLVERLRAAQLFTIPTGAAWANDALLFSAAGPQGIGLYRQRLVPPSFRSVGDVERLTSTGSDSAWLPSSAKGRVAFLNSQADANLWSVALDTASGVAHGRLRRMTRGSGPLGYLSVTGDLRTLAYFSFRLGTGDVFLRDLHTDSERLIADGPAGPKSYSAISWDGRSLAYGLLKPGGERASRPVVIVSLADGVWRTLGDDCGGRPREWVDERSLILERVARLNSIGLIDTESGDQRDLLKSAEQSLRNPRLSPDRRWLAFDASRPGEPARVSVAPFRKQTIPESEWVAIERSASHPFWSVDGRLLYYMPIGTNPMVRGSVRARRFNDDGRIDGESISVFTSNDMLMPAYLPGTAPIVTSDQLILVLGDFRGDVWLMDLD